VQIIGWRSCRETQKAIRYCKERRIVHQFVDLNERELSPGEWKSILNGVPAFSLLDTTSRYYVSQGYAWREFETSKEVQEHPELLKTPLLREKGSVMCGFDPAWIDAHGGSA
jgi:arsenate reductase-like glutaredoxin family protein